MARLLHGVASGEPSTHSVLLWTRVTPSDPLAEVDVEWEIGGVRGTVTARPDADHAVRVVVDDLAPGTTYTYSFAVRGKRVEGRTATLPARADRCRIAVVCCARWGWNDYTAYRRAAAASVDLVLHLGDYVYEIGEEPPAGPPTDPRHDARTLVDYRRRHAQQRSHPAVQALQASAPMLALWDDHEVADNAPSDDDAAARARRAAGLRAWTEWMPVTVGHPSEPLDRVVHVDGLFDLALVDARFTGREAQDTDGPRTPPQGRTLLSEQQWSTIASAVASSRAPWTIVANQVQVGPTRLGFAPSLRPPFVRPVVNPDQWDGYPQERERLFDLLAGGAGSPLLLSGDLHSAWARRLRVGRELTCPSVAGETFADTFRTRTHLPAWLLRAAIRAFNRGIDVLELDAHGCLLLDIAPDRITATFDLGDRQRTVHLEP